MMEILRRTIIVSWLAAIAILGFGVLNYGASNTNVWFLPLIVAVPTWAAQFIILGVVSPFRLYR